MAIWLSRLGDDHVARMRHQRSLATGGDEQQVNRLLQHHALCDADESAVIGEGSVQRREGIALGIKVATEMRFNSSRIVAQRSRKALHLDTAGQVANRGKASDKVSIHENQRAGGIWKPVRQQFGLGDLRAWSRELERSLCDCGDVREAPVLVVCRGKSDFGKAREGVFAKLLQPRQVAAGSDLLEAREAVQIRIELWNRGRHAHVS